ncbi:hypothetical protein [Psychroflexus tropicus]|uniref:hypothetical protein n=1 Tax=Psychroflexus tropicus TaxID=197345 RepID=UPI000378EBBD|nr:hypothetical protein [Psychroflexus tropicus]
MKHAFIFIIVLFLINLIISCSFETNKTFNDKVDYSRFINDKENGYSSEREINGIKFRVLLKPRDLMALQEFDYGGLDNSEFSKLKKKYDKHIYIGLNLSHENKELLSSIPNTKAQYASLNRRLLFEMNKYVYLYNSSNDTLQFVDYLYPKMYGLSHSTSLLFVFKKDYNRLDDDYLFFSVKDIGLNVGELRFKIDTKKILNPHEFNL